MLVAAILLLITTQAPGTEPIRDTLDNGVRIALFVEPAADDDIPVQLWLKINSGSLAESDAQRGSSILLQHANALATASFDQEEIERLFAISGYNSLNGQGAFTHFNQTTYMLGATDAESTRDILSYYKDLLNGHQINGSSFDSAMHTLRAERAAGPRNNRELWIPDLFHGLLPGDRLPLPTIEHLDLLTLDAANAYAAEHYRAANATVIAVGDFNPQHMRAQIAAAFEQLPINADDEAPPHPHPLECIDRVTVAENIDSERTEIGLLSFTPISFAVMDAERGVRRVVRDRVASELVRHRINTQLRRSILGVEETDGSIVNMYNTLRAAQIVGAITTEQWDQTVTQLVAQTNRLVYDPISDEEFTRARRTCLLQWQSEGTEWPALSTHRKAAAINWIDSVGLKINPRSWNQQTAHVLATITNSEIHETIRARFDLDHANLLILAPKDAMPAVQEVRAVFEAAKQTRLAPLDDDWLNHGAMPIISSIPYGGEIRGIAQHTESGVWTATLNNNIIVHQRTMNDPLAISELRITLHHPTGDATLTDAAISSWRAASTSELSASDIRVILDEYNMSIDVVQSTISSQLIIRAPDKAFDRAIELGYVLLSHPEIDQQGFEHWQADKAKQPKQEPFALVNEAISGYCDEVFAQPEPEPCSVAGSITSKQAGIALHQLIRSSPIEIAIVGGGESESTLQRAATFFGSLPDRAEPSIPICATTVDLDASPERTVTLATTNESTQGVVVGLVACHRDDLETVRSLIVTGMVINARLDRLIPDHAPADLATRLFFLDQFPSRATLLTSVHTQDPAMLGDQIERIYTDLAKSPIHEDELKPHIELISDTLSQQLTSSAFWASRLAVLSLSGQSVEDVWGIQQAYLNQTPESIQEHFARSMATGRHLRIQIQHEK